MGETKKRVKTAERETAPIAPKQFRAMFEAAKKAESDSFKPITEKNASDFLQSIKKTVTDQPDESVKEQLEMLHHDLAAARQIQSKLLPESVPNIPGYDFAAYYSTAGAVGGDFYDFIQFDKNTLGILVADASGKGLSGSLLMVEARAVMRSMASVSSSPKEILIMANRVLIKDLQRGMFITLFYALLDLSKGVLKLASAGHMPMLLLKHATKKCFAVNPTGLVLGAATEEMFSQTLKETEVELEPGDRFVLYTDGVTELMDEKDNEFGKSRFVQCTAQYGHKTSDEYVRALVKQLHQHRAGFEQSDDITIVTGRTYPEEQMW